MFPFVTAHEWIYNGLHFSSKLLPIKTIFQKSLLSNVPFDEHKIVSYVDLGDKNNGKSSKFVPQLTA